MRGADDKSLAGKEFTHLIYGVKWTQILGQKVSEFKVSEHLR